MPGGLVENARRSPAALAQPMPSLRLRQRMTSSRGSHGSLQQPSIRAAASSSAPGAGPWQPWQGPTSRGALPGQPSPYTSPTPPPSPPPPPQQAAAPPHHQQASAAAGAAAGGAAAAGTATSPPNPAPTAKEGEQQQDEPLSNQSFHLKPVHILLFSLIFVGGAGACLLAVA